MLKRNREIVDQRMTDGQLFINEYSDGMIMVESVNGGMVEGSREDWIFCFQEMMNILRSGTR
jgi:hypothetical protein